MAETIVGLERQPGASEEKCLAFLRCLYGHLEHGPHRDRAADAEREPQVSDRTQPVTVSGAKNLAAARTAVAEAGMSCDASWQRLYRFAD